MALKRLDEEFELKPGTQLLPYMKRLLPSLEGRFQSLETSRETYEDVLDALREVGLKRINELLIPATQDILEVTKLGFLLGPSSSSVKLELGQKTFIVNEGPQRETFTPSPYVIVEREANIDDYAIARVMDYSQETGELILQITAWHGNPGPHTDWVISSTPGMADSTKLYHDAVGPMADQVAADTAETRQARDDVIAAANALEEAGLDAQEFIRRDGAVPFIALQTGIHPPAGANDSNLATTAWSRARMIEYASVKMNRAGDTMTGPLLLSGAPTQANQAATKQYVDTAFGSGGTMTGPLTITTSYPRISLQPTSPGQWRGIEGRSLSGITRWYWMFGDQAAESGNNNGSDIAVYRYNDLGQYLDTAFAIIRATGQTRVNALSVNGTLDVRDAINVSGDIATWRPNTNSGVIFLNAARNAYLYYDGSNYSLPSGGISIGGNQLWSGHISCYSIYTQGYGITTWGLTSHGNMTVNGQMYINGGLRLYGQGSNYLEFYDSDWGPMYIHHNNENIGFLNNGGGWIWYTTNSGYVWTAQYGWLHDYVNNTANNYAWSAANYRYNQLVNNMRNAYIGDLHTSWGLNQIYEPWGGGVQTGVYADNNYIVHWRRQRQPQMNIAGNWYAVGYA